MDLLEEPNPSDELKRIANEEASVFSEAMLTYYLQKSGCMVAEESITKLAGLDLQEFLLEVIGEAIKSQKQTSKKKKVEKEDDGTPQSEEVSFSLNASDLEPVLLSKGVQASKAPFHPL